MHVVHSESLSQMNLPQKGGYGRLHFSILRCSPFGLLSSSIFPPWASETPTPISEQLNCPTRETVTFSGLRRPTENLGSQADMAQLRGFPCNIRQLGCRVSKRTPSISSRLSNDGIVFASFRNQIPHNAILHERPPHAVPVLGGKGFDYILSRQNGVR